MMEDPPEYTEPAEFEVDGEFSRGEITQKRIKVKKEVIIDIDDDSYPMLIVRLNNDLSPKQFWTAVHYLREYGAPGVWKEKLKYERNEYRLGALYCMGPFELTFRETDYKRYGENPL